MDETSVPQPQDSAKLRELPAGGGILGDSSARNIWGGHLRDCLFDWLRPDSQPLNLAPAIDELSPLFARLEPHVGGPVLSRIQAKGQI